MTSACDGNNPNIGNISQTNVVWRAASVVANRNNQNVEIWVGVPSANAGTVATITMIGGTGSYGMETAWIIEESGISSTVDVSASNFGAFGTTGDSGTTLPTTHSNEFVPHV